MTAFDDLTTALTARLRDTIAATPNGQDPSGSLYALLADLAQLQGGGGSSSGGLTQAQVRAAIESASNLDSVETLLIQIANQPNPVISSAIDLSDPGQSLIFDLLGRTMTSIGVSVSNINTSVSIGLYAKLIPAGILYPMPANGNPVITLTSNGAYLYTWQGTAEQIVVKFESEVGGTTATINVVARGAF